MPDIAQMQEGITRRIKEEMQVNESLIARLGKMEPGQLTLRMQSEIAHKTVGLLTAQRIVDTVFAEHAPLEARRV